MFQWMNWMKQHKSMGPPQADTARQWSVFEIFLLAFAVSDRLLRFFGKFLPLNHSASFCLSLSVVCLSFARLLPLVSPSSTFLLPIFHPFLAFFHRHFTALFATISARIPPPAKSKDVLLALLALAFHCFILAKLQNKRFVFSVARGKLWHCVRLSVHSTLCRSVRLLCGCGLFLNNSRVRVGRGSDTV